MAYAGTAELVRALRLTRTPSAAEGTVLQECLDAAYVEINMECFGGTVDTGGTVTVTGSFATPYPPLAVSVNVKRAVEHWRGREAGFGLVGIGDSIPVFSARDSWDRHAHELAPLKRVWGFA